MWKICCAVEKWSGYCALRCKRLRDYLYTMTIFTPFVCNKYILYSLPLQKTASTIIKVVYLVVNQCKYEHQIVDEVLQVP